MKQAICDSGPLTHLWQIGLWSALKLFSTIHLSTQVAQETRNHVPIERLAEFATSDVQIHNVNETEIDVARRNLSSGINLQEAALSILILAQRLAHDFVLTDDLALRQTLEEQGYTPMGSVGILLHAYKTKQIDKLALDHAIDQLFVESTLYLSPSFKAYVRRLINELTQND
ncbi:MAG: hypothetical protein U0350_19290 [Caldilineaceae bacterium]